MSNCCYDSIIDCEILPEETIQAATDNTIEINTKAYTGVNTSDIQMNVDNENLTISAEFTQSEKINELIQKLDDDDFGKVDDVKVDNISVVENKIGELSTINGDYNKDTNKLATENDIPTQASEVNALPDTTKYGASLSASGSTLQLKDQDGNDLGNPVTISTEDTGATSIEVVGDGNAVTSASYNENNRKITLNKGETFLKKNEYIVDDELSNISENPVQNKVISELIPSNASSSNKLATKSDVPTKVSQLDNDSEFVTRTTDDLLYYTKSNEFGDLAFKDNVNYETDVTNKPQIGNAIVTIQQNHENKGIFRLNQSENALINIDTPTQTSQLNNDSGFIDKYTDDLTNYTKTSEFGDLAFEDSVDYETQVNNKPIIPVVNNGTLKIQKNGTTVATFNANSDQNVTANILVPEVNNGTLTIQKNGVTVGTFSANSDEDTTINIEADQQVQSDWDENDSSAPDYIKNKPINLSEFINDTGFITNTVDNLTNYYKKSETYTQTEVNTLIAAIKTIKVEIVAELPTASVETYFNTSKTIYMVRNTSTSGNNYYDEYITIRSGSEGDYTYSWENIGSTQIDLSNYVQKTFTIAGIDMQDDITTNELANALGLSSYVKATKSNYNCDNCYDVGIYMVSGGSNCPSGSQYGTLFVMPYRQASGNAKPDFAVQIFLPNGDDSTKPNSMFYRTGLANSWNEWIEVARLSDIPFLKGQGRYIEDGVVKYSSGSIEQTGTTVAEDSGWVQPIAEGRGSAAFGRGTVAGGQEDWNNPDNNNHDYAFASGKNSKAYGDSSFAANRGTKSTGANSASFNENTQSKGKDSFSANYGSIAYDKGTFATGYYTEARGEYSFTANSGDTNGKYAFAANEETRANAEAASSFGRSTQANGANSMATGHLTTAGHTSSFAGGESTKTSKANQAVFGQYNEDDSNALFIVGDGTADNARSNCFEAGSDGNGKFIKVGSTRFNENQIAKKSNIPSSINGLGGGTLTSQLVITGGDASSDAKIAISNSGSGQITDETTHTLFGFTSNNADTLTIGHNSYKTNLRGSGTRPTYKGDDLALYSDLPSVPVKSISYGGTALTPDANGDVALPISAIESYTITSWTSLSSSSPYTYQATVTATATIGNDTIVELINDQAVLFAQYGFAIGSVSGQNITFYSIGEPSSNVTLKVRIGG